MDEKLDEKAIRKNDLLVVHRMVGGPVGSSAHPR